MRVLIVDDDAIVVQSLATILSAEDGIDVAGTCLSGVEAVQEFRRLRPDVLLMDIRMPGADGLSAAEEILEGTRRRALCSSRPSLTTSTSSGP